MIKRINKVTSLLVAAAAIVSVVPANAAEKLNTQEGTIYNAVAFDGGKYLFEGYKNDEDDSSVYYNNGSKDSAMEDVEDYTHFVKYGSKSILASKNDADEDDQYIIDMSTGKASDDRNLEDIKSDLETKLNQTLRKVERYEESRTPVNGKTIELLEDNKFGDVWFSYKATTENAVEATGYTNESGKYIDASVTANISVFDGTKMVKVEEFGKKKDGVTVTIAEDPKVLGQDANYIYRLVDVNIDGAVEKSATYLQKISKAQGSTKDEAYLPKTVESFIVSTKLNNDDAEEAAEELKAADKYVVVDGVLYSYRYTNGKVYVAKYTTKRNEKIEYKVNGSTRELDTPLLKSVDTVDEKCEATTKDTVTTDVDGNVWFLSKGKIYRSVKGGDFEEVYTCDRTMEKLDVYNKNNLIVWNESNEIFATVQGVEKVEEKEEQVVETVKTGWQSENGTWYLYDAAGNKLTGWQLVNGTWYYMDPATTAMRTGWVSVNGAWYFMNANGSMATGWVLDGATWYYMNSNGSMATGWVNDNGTWYYMNANGSMAANTTVDGYRLGANGAWVR